MVENAGATVRCVYLPLAEAGLLVPSSAVAEVIVVPPIDVINGAPYWLAGLVDWRGTRLPLLRVEAALGESETEFGVRGHVAVMHVLDEDSTVHFYGIGTQRLPAVVLATERATKFAEPTLLVDWVQSQIVLEIGDALVPRLDLLEQMAISSLPASECQ